MTDGLPAIGVVLERRLVAQLVDLGGHLAGGVVLGLSFRVLSGIDRRDQAAEGVVDVLRGPAGLVGAGDPMAGGVVGRGRLGAVGEVGLDELAAGVVDERRAVAERVDRRGLVAVGVVLRLGRVSLGVGRRRSGRPLAS